MKKSKFLSMLMVCVMFLSNISVNVMADNADTYTEISTEDATTSGGALNVLSDDIDVEFNITGKWNYGFNGEITIINLTNKVIEDWQIEMTFPHEIETIWNAKVESYENGIYNIKNAGDNNNINIPVGGNITFGFKAKHDGEITEPSEIYLATAKRKAEKELYTTDFQLLNDWGSGFTAQITITNNTNDDIEGWHLLFDFDKEMTSIWNAAFESYEDGRYTISNAEYNSVIPANGSVTFGFIGTPGNVESKPSKFELIESNNNDRLFISFDESDFLNVDDKFYVFDKPDKLNGNVYSLYGLKELKYTISYGSMELASNTISADDKGNWTITPATLMWENNFDNIGNVITVEAEDLRGNKTKNSIKLYSHYFDEDLFASLDYGDNDGDGLFNCEETIYGTDIEIVDTDDDGLNDYYEIKFSLTNPLEKDTDGNGTEDGDEDFDNDTLSNKEEMIYTSDPHTNDTDGDGLKDNEEIKHNTNVWMQDTDTDGLFDPLELELGTDPLNPDSNGNDILDGDESYSRTITPDTDEMDERVVPTLEISAAPNLINTVEVSKVTDTVFLVEEMPGFLGSGYDFEMAGTFDTAKLTFKFDSEYLNIPDFNPTIYYFNEDNQVFEPLDNQNVDLTNCTVSADLEHFSQYILLDRTAFEKAWQEEIIAPVGDLRNSLDVVLCIDSSGSMEWNDKDSLRKKVAIDFINSLDTDDRVAIVDFDSSAKILSELTTDKSSSINAVNKLDASGGTSLASGIGKSLNCLSNSEDKLKFIIMLTDGNGSYSNSLNNQAVSQNVKIYTIGLGSGVATSTLQNIATATGGRYYYAEQANDLIKEFKTLTDDIKIITTDTDGDGLSDYHEMRLRLCNGKLIQTDINNPDTDGDGILDGDELVPVFLTTDVPSFTNGSNYFRMISNPIMYDSDMDGLADFMEAFYVEPNNTYEHSETVQTSTNNNWQLPNGYMRLKSTLGYMYTKSLKGDTDGDGLTDLEELGDLININGEEYYNLNSNPMVKDSDYDGVDDSIETKCCTGLVIHSPYVNYNNPLEYNYSSNDTIGFGILDPVITLPKKASFNPIGNNGIFEICSLNAKEKIIKNTQTGQCYALVAKSGVEVRGGTINASSGDFRGCHYDEIYFKVKKRDGIFNKGVEVYKSETYEPWDEAFKLSKFIADAAIGDTKWLPSDFLYYDASKDCCYTNEHGDGFNHDGSVCSIAWKNIHWYERFWMNAEYDRFLPFDENVVKSNTQTVITSSDEYSDIKAVYHNPLYNTKYCSADGLEGLYGNKGTKLSLYRGNIYYDELYRNSSASENTIRSEIAHDNSCINKNYDACMMHGPTFNYCQGNDYGHYYFDMLPYYWWGNCP